MWDTNRPLEAKAEAAYDRWVDAANAAAAVFTPAANGVSLRKPSDDAGASE